MKKASFYGQYLGNNFVYKANCLCLAASDQCIFHNRSTLISAQSNNAFWIGVYFAFDNKESLIIRGSELDWQNCSFFSERIFDCFLLFSLFLAKHNAAQVYFKSSLISLPFFSSFDNLPSASASNV